MTRTARTPSEATRPLVRVRLAAYILDVVLVTVVGLVLTYAVSRLVQGSKPAGHNAFNPGDIPVLAVSAFSFALDLGYFTFLWHTRGRTLGMQALGLWVSDAHDGGRLSYRQSLIRWAVVNLAVLATVAVGLVATLGLLSAFFDYAWYFVLLASTARSASNQGLHDRAAGSVVTYGPVVPEPIGPTDRLVAAVPVAQRRGARRRRPPARPPGPASS